MEHKFATKISIDSTIENEQPKADDEFQELLQELEQQRNWDGRPMVKYDGFWYPLRALRPMLSAQKNFRAKDTDIILSTMPKAGTTWLKSLAFSIAKRNSYTIDQSPLLHSNPHLLVPFFEFRVYMQQENPDLEHIPSPRIFATHMPFRALPKSILESDCKIIYICRNLLDQFVSYYHFLVENRVLVEDAVPLQLNEAFDMFCQGIHLHGPLWEQMLEYWNAHLKNPQKVLFLKYEDLKAGITFHTKKIAEFLGFPFSEEEEKEGLIKQISTLCSFENLRNLEVNKTGFTSVIKNSTLFRKGEVGDSVNYLTPAMVQRLEKIVESKLEGSGLTFEA